MLRLAFGRPWRQTEGLLGSLMRLLGLDLPVSDHTTFSRRSADLAVAAALTSTDGPVAVVIDPTGLKVFGTGEWHLEKHGGQARRSWRKLHLAVSPDTGEILASELTSNEEGDASLVGPLLDQITRPIGAVLADGAYDGEPVYRAVAERASDAEVIIPPRPTAVTSDTAPRSARPPHQDDRRSGAVWAGNGRSSTDGALSSKWRCLGTRFSSDADFALGLCPRRGLKRPSAARSRTS